MSSKKGYPRKAYSFERVLKDLADEISYETIEEVIDKKKKTEFYLLKQKSLSEGDLFITDYIKTKQRLKKLTNELDILKLRVDNLKNNKKKVIKLYENE